MAGHSTATINAMKMRYKNNPAASKLPVYGYVHIWTYRCIDISIYGHIYIRIYTYMDWICPYIYMPVYLSIYGHIHTRRYTYMDMSVYPSIYGGIHIRIYVNMYIIFSKSITPLFTNIVVSIVWRSVASSFENYYSDNVYTISVVLLVTEY